MGSAENAEVDKNSKMWRTALEVLEPETVTVEGKLPAWLTGSYYRVGPGKFDFGDNYSLRHWLDGYALISKFNIDGPGQSVTFQSKYLRTDTYERAVKADRPAVAEFATPAVFVDNKKGFFSRLIPQIIPEMTHNTNHAFFMLGSGCDSMKTQTLFTTNGAGVLNEFDPMTLDCLEQLDPSKYCGLNMCTAHPLTDAETNISYNIGFSLVLTGLKYNVIRIKPSTSVHDDKDQLKKAKILCSIPTQWTTSLSFLHSFGMTRNFIILIEQPLTINLSRMLNSSVRGKQDALRDWLEWKSDATVRFYIIEKASGHLMNKNLSIVSSELFFFLHFINTFEDPVENEIVLDLSTYENADVIMGSSNILSHVRKTPCSRNKNVDDELLDRSPTTMRFRIPLDRLGIDIRLGTIWEIGTKVTEPVLTVVPDLIIPEGGLELATINRNFSGKPYQYFYASGLMTQGLFKNTLCKVDVLRKEVTPIKMSGDYIFGEPIFTSAGGASDEDDGILIVPMTDVRKDEPDMLFFFNARDMTEIGRAVFNNWIPSAIHGIYLPNL